MDPQLFGLLEPAIIFATMLGVAFGVKLLIWGKGPIRRIRRSSGDPALEQRVAELEERSEQWAELMAQQRDLLEELVERQDFTERMLTRQRMEGAKALEKPEESTPV